MLKSIYSTADLFHHAHKIILIDDTITFVYYQ